MNASDYSPEIRVTGTSLMVLSNRKRTEKVDHGAGVFEGRIVWSRHAHSSDVQRLTKSSSLLSDVRSAINETLSQLLELWSHTGSKLSFNTRAQLLAQALDARQLTPLGTHSLTRTAFLARQSDAPWLLVYDVAPGTACCEIINTFDHCCCSPTWD
jgi:hypothetical protein